MRRSSKHSLRSTLMGLFGKAAQHALPYLGNALYNISNSPEITDKGLEFIYGLGKGLSRMDQMRNQSSYNLKNAVYYNNDGLARNINMKDDLGPDPWAEVPMTTKDRFDYRANTERERYRNEWTQVPKTYTTNVLSPMHEFGVGPGLAQRGNPTFGMSVGKHSELSASELSKKIAKMDETMPMGKPDIIKEINFTKKGEVKKSKSVGRSRSGVAVKKRYAKKKANYKVEV